MHHSYLFTSLHSQFKRYSIQIERQYHPTNQLSVMLMSRSHHHVVVVTLVIALACTIGITVGDKVRVTSPDEHASVEEARNFVKKGKKTKRSKDDSVQQQDDDDTLEATITLLVKQSKSHQEVITLQ